MVELGPRAGVNRLNAHDPNATPNTAFPNLTPRNHRAIGPATYEFNCIAWACGNSRQWWQPGPHFYWPISCDPDDATVQNLLVALTTVGFQICSDRSLETAFEKIAVYATPTEYTHAARLMSNGKWTSKLGVDVLIEHDAPEDVAGGIYGNLLLFMRRQIPTINPASEPAVS